MKEYLIKVEHKVTEKDLKDIIETALGNSGIWYWAESAESNSEEYTPQECLFNNVSMDINDSEEEKIHELTLEKFIKGLELGIKKGLFDLDDYDGPQADSVIQLAIFGKITYA